MSLGENLQQFLTHKISDIKIKRKELLMKCGLNQSIFNKMLDGSFSNPKLTTVTKLADFFHCSIDEILGRDPKYYASKKQTFHPINSHSITNNLLSVVQDTMQELDISAYQLAKRIHVSSNTLNMFLDPNVSATPGAATTLALANFLDASIDDMIGRRPPSRTQEQKQEIPKQLSSLSKQDLEKLSNTKHSVKSSAPQNQNIKNTTSAKSLSDQKDEGRSR